MTLTPCYTTHIYIRLDLPAVGRISGGYANIWLLYMVPLSINALPIVSTPVHRMCSLDTLQPPIHMLISVSRKLYVQFTENWLNFDYLTYPVYSELFSLSIWGIFGGARILAGR